jgi:hypothetical protein
MNLLRWLTNLQLYIFILLLIVCVGGIIIDIANYGLLGIIIGRFRSIHLLIAIPWLTLSIMIRQRMPHTWKGLIQTFFTTTLAGLTGETIFIATFAFYWWKYWIALTPVQILVGRWWIFYALLYGPLLITRCYQSYHWRRMLSILAGLGAIIIVWITRFNFIVSECGVECGYGYYLYAPVPNSMECLYWATWLIGLIISLKSSNQLRTLYGSVVNA